MSDIEEAYQRYNEHFKRPGFDIEESLRVTKNSPSRNKFDEDNNRIILNNWHKYPEDKPKNSDEYIVAFNSGNVYTAHYSTRFNKWVDPDGAFNLEDSKVIAWTEFPKPPKFD